MFENITKFFKKLSKKQETSSKSKDTARERLHLVLMQDRANVSADFLDLMKQEIIEVIKKYIEVDESAIDVRLTNKENEDGTNGAPALYANIPILNIKEEAKKEVKEKEKENQKEKKKLNNKQEKKQKQENTEKQETATEIKRSEESAESTERTEKPEEKETENKESNTEK